jgi:hypothetical protein
MGIDPFFGTIAAGVLSEVVVEKCVRIENNHADHDIIEQLGSDSVTLYEKLCKHNGTGYWLILCLIPFTFAIIGAVRAPSHNIPRFFLTFAILLALNMTVFEFGQFALQCSGHEDSKDVFDYVSVGISAMAVLVITLFVIFR